MTKIQQLIKPKWPILALICILVLGFLLRTTGLNWDQGHHLHPDERFLTMVGTAMKVPPTFSQYLDPSISKMNPTNIGFAFYVYGLFPMTLNKLAAIYLQMDNYTSFTLLGRVTSAIVDCITLLFVFLITRKLFQKSKKVNSLSIWASFVYALTVMSIQLSHFFATDTFITMFLIASFYFLLSYYNDKGVGNLIAGSIAFGLAVGSKINAIYFLPAILPLIFFAPQVVSASKNLAYRFFKKISTAVALIFVFFLLAGIVTKISSPYYFRSGKIFDFNINPIFKKSLLELKNINGHEQFFPPAIQWISKGPQMSFKIPYCKIDLAKYKTCEYRFFPSLFAPKNIINQGLGWGISFFVIIGIIILLVKGSRNRSKDTWVYSIMGFFALAYFIYQSVQFGKSMRYFHSFYPLFAIFGAYGVVKSLDFIDKILQKMGLKDQKLTFSKFLVRILVIISISVWPLMFMSIYSEPHTRVNASYWMYKNLPNNSYLLEEHWDDFLPLGLLYEHRYGKIFTGEQLGVFAPDVEAKINQIKAGLQKGDYYVMTSNRAWGSIGKVSWKYPWMAQFYQDMFDEKLGYKKIKEFTSYPKLKLWGKTIWEINDDESEEAFTVYDHPKVIIFQKIK